MPAPDDEYLESPYPSSWRLTFDLGKTGLAKHHVRALLELDVTKERAKLREARRSGARISFFAWLIRGTADDHNGWGGGAREGWTVPFGMHPLCLAFVSLSGQPAILKGTIQGRGPSSLLC